MPRVINNKLEYLWNNVSKNQNDIANMKRIIVNPISYSTIEKAIVGNLLTKYPLTTQHSSDPTVFIWGVYDVDIIVPFDNIPVWALSSVSNRILFYAGESQLIDLESHSISYKTFSHWQYKDEKYIYRTYIKFNCYESEISNWIPIYVDFDILIQNPRKFINQQGYKS